jgi:hypothetical protein
VTEIIKLEDLIKNNCVPKEEMQFNPIEIKGILQDGLICSDSSNDGENLFDAVDGEERENLVKLADKIILLYSPMQNWRFDVMLYISKNPLHEPCIIFGHWNDGVI